MKSTVPLLAVLTLMSHADELDFGVARAQWYSYGDLESQDGGGDLELQLWRLQSPLSKPIQLADSLYFMPAMRYELLDYQGPAAGKGVFEDELHMIELPLLFVYQESNSPWSYNARISPGLSSDMHSVSGDDVFIDARLGTTYQVNDKLNINFGVAYTRAIGEPQVFPYLGFVYEMNDQWQFALRGFSFEARCQVSDAWIVRFIGEAGGGYWNIDTPDSDYLTLQTYRAGVTVERELKDNLWLVAGAGYAMANQVRWVSDSGKKLHREDFDGGAYFTVGLRLGDW